jgi:thymidine kinase
MINGKIELITGPMGSGKSEELIRRLNRYAIAKKNVILFRPTKDTRQFLSRSGLLLNEAIKIMHVDSLPDLDLIDNYDVIGIDEAQFFEDIWITNDYANNNKLVILSSVSFHPSITFFKPIIDLYPSIEDITNLKAVCMDCGEEASFTVRVSSDTNEVSIGTDQYKAVCRRCKMKYD